TDHPRRCPQEQGPCTRRPRCHGAGPRRPHHGVGLPATVLDVDVSMGARSTLTSRAKLPAEADEAVRRTGILRGVCDAVDPIALVVLQDNVSTTITELHAGAVEWHQRRRPRADLDVEVGG